MLIAKLFQVIETLEKMENLMGLFHLLNPSVGIEVSRERIKFIRWSEAGFADRASQRQVENQQLPPAHCGFKTRSHVHWLTCSLQLPFKEERTFLIITRIFSEQVNSGGSGSGLRSLC